MSSNKAASIKTSKSSMLHSQAQPNNPTHSNETTRTNSLYSSSSSTKSSQSPTSTTGTSMTSNTTTDLDHDHDHAAGTGYMSYTGENGSSDNRNRITQEEDLLGVGAWMWGRGSEKRKCRVAKRVTCKQKQARRNQN
ncbi:hypothetical protein IFR05_004934 [Cadophora sp. M221]|nr:hypothetical protein IFR05_004934 [Cadophora sp. M221]